VEHVIDSRQSSLAAALKCFGPSQQLPALCLSA